MNFKEFLEGKELFNELMELTEGVDDRDYAVATLDKINKVAAYLIKSRLNNPNDLARFEKFLTMIHTEMPKLEKSIDAIHRDLEHSMTNHVSQSPRRFNYDK